MTEYLSATNEQMKNIINDQLYNYNIDVSEVDFSDIVKQNLVSKERFYKKMEQGRLIIPVELEQDKEALDHLVSKFTRSLGITLYNHINTYFSFEEIINNSLTENKSIEKYSLEFGKGMKFTKALKKIMEKMKYNHGQREKIINDYSLVLNEKKLKGTLVLSVNPIDFLTMSLSDTWSSCLSPGGEYESGTIGYAIDHNTVLAFFISSSDEEKLKRNEYVNKKWRKVLIVSTSKEDKSDQSILASRGYPYDGPMLTDEAVKHLSILLFETNMVRYDYEKVYNRVSSRMFGPGYSDLGLRNQIYVYSVVQDLEDSIHREGEKIQFRFGANYACLHCGHSDAEAESFACVECGGYESCEDCGEILSRDDGYYTAYGYTICEGCMDHSYAFASNDDELYNVEDLTWVESMEEYVTDKYALKHCSVCIECSLTYEDDEMVGTEKGMLCAGCAEEVEPVE